MNEASCGSRQGQEQSEQNRIRMELSRSSPPGGLRRETMCLSPLQRVPPEAETQGVHPESGTSCVCGKTNPLARPAHSRVAWPCPHAATLTHIPTAQRQSNDTVIPFLSGREEKVSHCCLPRLRNEGVR